MKPHSKMYAKDSERLIVFDENMKQVSIVKVFAYVAGYVCLFGLTAYGLIGGITSKPVMDKLMELDNWADNPLNENMINSYLVGLTAVVCGWIAGWVFLFRKK